MLAELPNELLIVIAENINSDQDINALARTNRRFFTLLDPVLYQHNETHSPGSALLWAATWGVTVAARKALEAGANPGGEPIRGYTVPQSPLNRAAEYGYIEVVDMLLRTGKVDTNRKDRDGRAAIALAAGYGYAEVVDMLLRHDGVDVEQKDKEGQSALALAAYYGHAEIVGMLLCSGRVDVEQRDRDGCTPLILAADGGSEGNHAEVVVLLLAYGADPDSRANHRGTPLLNACGHGRGVEVLELLLSTGRVEVDGSHALMCAAGSGNAEAVMILLEVWGADTQAGRVGDWTALHCATNIYCCPECWRPEDPHYDADRSDADGYAVAESGEIVRLLVEWGCDVSARDDSGRTALWYAARNNWLAMGKFLLEGGGDEVYLEDEGGWSPLDVAMYRGNDEFVKMLQRVVDDRLMEQYWDDHKDDTALSVPKWKGTVTINA
ncbi:ankyrin repeat domain-containing protein [Candidatus Bathyarchaeota archaeon]|nr:ankyrin repeat domain-containing protein [Candidatus Bathyarchaeota archaeon]